MQNITLYRYKRDGDGITVSPQKPNKPYTTLHRLVADEGKVLVKGSAMVACIDVESAYGWDEISIPEEVTE